MKTPKPAPVLIDADAIARDHAKTGQLWVKTCEFDHPQVDVRAWCLVWDQDGQPMVARWITYDNTLSKSKPRSLDLLAIAKPTDDPAQIIAKLEKASWVIHRPAAPPVAEPAPKKRGGRAKKTA